MQSACAILYFRLWPVSFDHIFSHYLLKGKIFGKGGIIDHKMCLIFLPETFLILKKNLRDVTKNVRRSSCKEHVRILMKLELSRQIFEEQSNMTIHENPSSGRRVVPCGKTDGQT